MKITKVSLSCDNNSYYSDFWEPVSRIWKYRFGIEPHLWFIGDKQSAPAAEHGQVVCIKPVDGIPIHTQTQWARFYFVSEYPDDIWITSDIDMFPLSHSYFINSIKNINTNSLVALNSDMKNYFPVCYNIATGKKFQEILELETHFKDDVRKIFFGSSTDTHTIEGNHYVNWGADEKYSSSKICKYRDAYPEQIIQLPRPGGHQSARRIDRSHWEYDIDLLKQEFYVDCHSLRPYSLYRNEIERVISFT